MNEPTEQLPTLARRPTSWPALAGVVLVVLGLGCWALYRLTAGGERHSFAVGALAPAYVQVQDGRTYSIGIPGGARTVKARGADLGRLACEISPAGEVGQQLGVLPEPDDTKAENQVATFVAPLTGRVHVACAGLPAVFVDNAEDAGTDWSGMWLVLASASLAVGLPFVLTAMRSRQRFVR